MHMLHKSCVPLFWHFVSFYRSLPLIMGVNADLNGLVFVGNKCWGVIGFSMRLGTDFFLRVCVWRFQTVGPML